MKKFWPFVLGVLALPVLIVVWIIVGTRQYDVADVVYTVHSGDDLCQTFAYSRRNSSPYAVIAGLGIWLDETGNLVSDISFQAEEPDAIGSGHAVELTPLTLVFNKVGWSFHNAKKVVDLNVLNLMIADEKLTGSVKDEFLSGHFNIRSDVSFLKPSKYHFHAAVPSAVVNSFENCLNVISEARNLTPGNVAARYSGGKFDAQP